MLTVEKWRIRGTVRVTRLWSSTGAGAGHRQVCGTVQAAGVQTEVAVRGSSDNIQDLLPTESTSVSSQTMTRGV